MSKAVEQFTSWYQKNQMPAEIMCDLYYETQAIDKGVADSLEWGYLHGQLNELGYVQAMAAFIVEHEQFVEMINKKD